MTSTATNERWIESLREELHQAGRWIGLLEQAVDRLEASESQLDQLRRATSGDSELQGELDLVQAGNDEYRKRHAAIEEICHSAGIKLSFKVVESVQRLADALTAERAKVAELRAGIAGAVPFLQDAWTACFRGSESAVLSAEERGMGRLLAQFTAIANGEQVVPLGWISSDEHAEQLKAAGEYYYKMVGNPNELPEHLKRWCSLGETCVDGIKRAANKVAELQRALETANAANAHRAEESQLEPVGWLCRDHGDVLTTFIHYCEEVPTAKAGDYSSAGHNIVWTPDLDGFISPAHHRRVYLGPAEPIVSNEGKAVTE